MPSNLGFGIISLQQSEPFVGLVTHQQSLVPWANELIGQLLFLSPDQTCALIAYFLLPSLEWNISPSLPIWNRSMCQHLVACNKCSHLSYSCPSPSPMPSTLVTGFKPLSPHFMPFLETSNFQGQVSQSRYFFSRYCAYKTQSCKVVINRDTFVLKK